MTEAEILGRLGQLARDLMGEDSINPTMDTTGKDIPGWDSATFINFVVAVEMEFGVRLGLNSSSNAAVNGDNYPRLTNYIAATLNAGMGQFIGRVQSPTVQQQAKATLDNFLQNMFQQGMIQDWKVVLDATNNPQTRVALGYMQADVKVVYLSIIKYFLVNLEGGQTVVIARNASPNFQ